MVYLFEKFDWIVNVATTTNSFSQDAKVISLVCLPHMMSHVYWLVMPPMFAVLIPAFGITGDLATTKIAAVYSLFALSTFVFQTPVGFIVDRFGARALLVAGLTLEATAIGLFGVATEYWQLMILGNEAFLKNL